MAIMKWESPRHDYDGNSLTSLMPRSMRRLFEDFDRNFFNITPLAHHGTFTPMVDINEDKDNLYFIAELPGLSSDDVKLTVSDGVLTIRGEKNREEEHHDRNFYRMERSYGEFVRQFTLPEDVKEDDIEADFNNGVLEIVVPKKEPSKPNEREVKIGSGLRSGGEVKLTNGQKNGNGQREKITT